MEIKPWEKVGSPRVLAKSRGRSLVSQKFRDPYNKEVTDYTLFKCDTLVSMILAVTKKDEVLVVRQFRQANETITLELPGGSSRHGQQNPEAVAKEELAQETGGYEPEKIIPLMPKGLLTESGYILFPYLFLECEMRQGDAKLDKGEYVELVKIPRPKWIELCLTGQINDFRSIAVTALALSHF